MTPGSYNNERSKFQYLLHLSNEQVKAIEMKDFFAFDRLQNAKATIIASLTDAPRLLQNDPTLATIIERIKESNRTAERLLYREVGRLRRSMTELQQFEKARRAYRIVGRRPSAVSKLGGDESSPRLIDRKS